MIERQQYYKELIAYLVEKYYQIQIDLTKDTEVPFLMPGLMTVQYGVSFKVQAKLYWLIS